MDHFFYDGRDLKFALEAHYNLWLVALSVTVACLAAYPLPHVTNRIHAAEKSQHQWLWIFAAAVSWGIGGWAMHFIGMLAFELPMTVNYNVFITALSILPSILAMGVLCYIATRPDLNRIHFVFSTIIVATGIAAMHVIGMAAMVGVGQHIIMMFEPTLFVWALSICFLLVIIVVRKSVSAAYPWEQPNSFWPHLQSAIVIGCGIAGVHYISMAVTYFFPGESSPAVKYALDTETLALWVFLGSALVTALTLFITVVDNRLQQMASDQLLIRSRMHEAIESLSDAFSLYDQEDRLVECNQRYRELMNGGFSIAPGMTFEKLIRKVASSGVILDAEGRVEEWMTERLAYHQAPRGHFVERYKGDRWIRVNERRIWNIGTVAIRTDITELSKAMAEAERVRVAAEAANRAKSAFLANMSHELRTPMNAIIGYSEMLLEDAVTEEENELATDLEKIRSASMHLLSLINEILDLSKIEAGKMDLYLEDFDLLSLIRDVETTIKPLVSKNNNTLVVEHPPLLPIMRADLTKLRQSLYNLLSNANKFTQNGQIIFSITTDNAGWVIFRVIDTGIGMSNEQVAKIFDTFTQADSSTTRKYGGTGLGLTITKKFCQMMGGDISVTSVLDKGSTFTIHLPIKMALPEVSPALTSSQPNLIKVAS